MTKKSVSITAEEIVDAIKKKILAGEIAPGQKINQNALAKELNVSRTPIINALNKLETEGLVDSIPNSGFCLHTNSLKEMAELFEIRQAIEMISAANAAEYATDEDIAYLKGLYEPFVGVEEIDSKQYLETDRIFHKKLLSYCDNQKFLKLNESMQIYHQSYVFGLIRSPGETLVEHLNIIEAIQARDPNRARLAMMNHLDYTGGYLKNVVDKLRGLGLDPNSIPFSSSLIDKT